MSDAAAPSTITENGIPNVVELPCGQALTLEERPRLVDPDVLDEPVLPRSAHRAERRSIAAGGEPARVAVREEARSGRHERGGVLTHPPTARDLFLVQCARPLGSGIVAQLVERPAEVDCSRTGGQEHLVRPVQILSVLSRQGEPVARRDADRWSAANGERADGVGDFRRRRAPQLDLLVRQTPLVEHDHGVVLEANDALWAQVPSSHEARYRACSSVS